MSMSAQMGSGHLIGLEIVLLVITSTKSAEQVWLAEAREVGGNITIHGPAKQQTIHFVITKVLSPF